MNINYPMPELEKAFYKDLDKALEQIEFKGHALEDWQKLNLCACFLSLGFLNNEPMILNISNVRRCCGSFYNIHAPTRRDLLSSNSAYHLYDVPEGSSIEFYEFMLAAYVPGKEHKNFIMQHSCTSEFLDDTVSHQLYHVKSQEELSQKVLHIFFQDNDIRLPHNAYYARHEIRDLLDLVIKGSAPCQEEVQNLTSWLECTSEKLKLEQSLKRHKNCNAQNHKI